METYAAVGSMFAQTTRLGEIGLTDAQFDAFLEGLRATFKGRPLPVDERARALHAEIGRRLEELVAREKRARLPQFTSPAAVETYMKEMVKKYHMERSDSGLAYLIMEPGTGSRPAPEDTVVLSCKVKAADAATDVPQLMVHQKRIKVADLLPGVAEAVQMISPGGAARLIVPPDLSFGSGEWPQGVERGPLLYMVVLDQVIPAP
ncbi:MAG TPA: FKBP-type peptidyl-prolyl cis-trans isomerase N-terminal domain-containing protein [Lacunisphaera sp.]|nr:FKBP-type peptidyl-prolyl cis-trans isomerase N-terminal domain-containing protein [Lacunisphaera sp.]